MPLEFHAVLAEIRDTLLETYASKYAMNQLILSHLGPRAWRRAAGSKSNGRTIAPIFAHLRNNRPVWSQHSRTRCLLRTLCCLLQSRQSIRYSFV